MKKFNRQEFFLNLKEQGFELQNNSIFLDEDKGTYYEKGTHHTKYDHMKGTVDSQPQEPGHSQEDSQFRGLDGPQFSQFPYRSK